MRRLSILFALTLIGAAPAKPEISGFAAYLVGAKTGALSRDVIAAPETLGNAVAGPAASVQTMVVARIDWGRDNPVAQGARLRLVATATAKAGPKRVVLDRSLRLGPASAEGVTHAAFLIDGTGCEPIELRATLLTPRIVASRQAELPFSCYE